MNSGVINLSDLPPPQPGKTGWPWNGEPQRSLPIIPDGSIFPQVSVVTPSYNQVQFIEETIRSVLLQGYPNLEYLIIDGGSTDGTVDVIRKYERWISHSRSEKDAGQADAINKGWRLSHGSILAYLNSDDTYTPGAILRAVEYLISHPEVAVVNGACNLINENSQILQTIPAWMFDLKSELRCNMICQQTVFIRRDPLFEVGLLDPGLHYVMDYDLWLKLGLAYKFGHINAVQANFRIARHGKSVVQTERFLNEILKVFERFFSRQDIPPKIRKLRSMAYSDYYAHEAPNSLYRPQHLMSPEQVKRMRRALWISIFYYPVRAKTIWTLAQIFDSYFNTGVARYLSRIWNKRRMNRFVKLKRNP
jgi:glycosyltransferase involved in cell wall biosynthesis